GWSGDTDYKIVNNTFICNGGTAISLSSINGFVLENNAAFSCYTYWMLANPTSVTADYNAFDSSGITTGHAFKWNNPAGDTYTTYRSVKPTLDTHSITPAGFGLGANYIPTVGSPLIGKGTNLSGFQITELSFDKAGNPRLATGAWDVGAYQSGSSGTPP